MQANQTSHDRRFVFVISGTGDEVIDGRDIEIRSTSLSAALDIADDRCAAAQSQGRGLCLSLIGERRGYQSSRRFFPLVSLTDLPTTILQLEKFGGHVVDPTLGSVDAEQSRKGFMLARYERAAKFAFGDFSAVTSAASFTDPTGSR